MTNTVEKIEKEETVYSLYNLDVIYNIKMDTS